MSEFIEVGTKECPIQKVIEALQSSEHLFSQLQKNWFNFAIKLEIPTYQVNKLRQDLLLDKSSFYETIHTLLSLWVARTGSGATLQILLEALKPADLGNSIEIFKTKLGHLSTASSNQYSKIPLKINQFLQNTQQNFSLVYSPDYKITIEKLHQFYTENLSHLNIQRAFDYLTLLDTKNPTKNIILIEEHNTENIKKFINFIETKKLFPFLKILLFPSEQATAFSHNIPICQDPMEWNDLSFSFKHKIISKVESLYELSLITPDDFKIEGEQLAELINGKSPSTFRHSLPPSINYYISRVLITRNVLNIRKIFEDPSKAVFLFSGIKREELVIYAGNQIVETTSAALYQEHESPIVSKYLLLDHPNHFAKLRNKIAKPIHWVQYENGKFSLEMSSGNMEAIKKNVDRNQNSIDEENFIEDIINGEKQQPVIISDSPGMGKSTLLINIGTKLKNCYKNRPVLFVILRNFAKQFHKLIIEGEVDISTKIKLLITEAFCQTELDKIVLSSKINSNKQTVELLLDGLDEVNCEYLQSTMTAIKIIQMIPSIRLWITTRPHILGELEENLSVLGYNIQGFTEENQIQFLKGMWKRVSPPKTHLEEIKLTKFARHCLETFKFTVKLDAYQDIAGLPLQCLMIAEVYEINAFEYATAEDMSLTPYNFTTSIAELYENLMNKKIADYKQKYLSEFTNLNRTTLLEIHAKFAINLIFPEYSKTLEKLFSANSNRAVSLGELLNIGILQKSVTSEEPFFIHRTLAEYLVAWFVSNQLKQEELCSLEFIGFLKEIFSCREIKVNLLKEEETTSYQFNNPTVLYFINQSVTQIQLGKVTNKNLKLIGESLKYYKMQLCHACAHLKLISLFNFFTKLPNFNNLLTYTANIDFLLLTVRYSSLKFVMQAFNHFENASLTCLPQMNHQLLRLAVMGGNLSSLEYLINAKQLREYVLKAPTIKKLYLHDCVTETVQCPDWIIAEKLGMISLLCKINRELLEEKDENGKTPLLCKDIHLFAVEKLISLKANVLAQDNQKNSILHCECQSYYFHQLLKCIPSDQSRKLVHLKNAAYETPLNFQIKYLEILPETLQLFKKLDADFNSIDKNYNSVLSAAIKAGRNSQTIRTLIRCGCNVWFKKGWVAKTLLHYAAEHGNVEAMKILIQEEKMDMNMKDWSWSTPVHYLLTLFGNVRNSELEMSLKTYSQKITENIFSIQGIGESIIHQLVTNRNSKAIRLLLDLGFNPNVKNEEGNTPLHVALSKWENIDVPCVQLLIGNGAKQNILNELGQTPFKLLWECLPPTDYLTKLSTLLEIGLDISYTDDKGGSPFSYVLATGEIAVELYQILKAAHSKEFNKLELSTMGNYLHRNAVNFTKDQFYVELKDYGNFGGDINKKRSNENSFLHVAVNLENEAAVKYLIGKGAKLDTVNNRKQTVLHYLCGIDAWNISLSLLSTLLNSGVNVYAKDDNNETFLHNILICRHKTNLSFDTFYDITLLLVNCNYSKLFSIAGGKDYCTPLHYLVIVNWKVIPHQILDILSENKVNFNAIDKEGNSILMYAVRKGYSYNVNFIKKLIALGCDAFYVNRNKMNLLHFAAIYGDAEVLRLFLKNGCNVNASDSNGKTALQYVLVLPKDKPGRYEKLRIISEWNKIEGSEKLGSL